MAKAAKTTKPCATKYDEKLAVKGSFIDLIQAAVKDAKNKTAEKKKAE